MQCERRLRGKEVGHAHPDRGRAWHWRGVCLVASVFLFKQEKTKLAKSFGIRLMSSDIAKAFGLPEYVLMALYANS